ncbi:MAG: hypothetical protein LBN42_03880 [Oscillospiraceae bacterium]|jgi:hypothetical protein|nr:hypothetical protein [Oscillospiraceae bacterium]
MATPYEDITKARAFYLTLLDDLTIAKNDPEIYKGVKWLVRKERERFIAIYGVSDIPDLPEVPNE